MHGATVKNAAPLPLAEVLTFFDVKREKPGMAKNFVKGGTFLWIAVAF